MFHFYTPWKNKTPPILVPRKFQLIKQLFWKILILKYAVLQRKDFSKEVILNVKTNWKRFLWNWKCCKNFLFYGIVRWYFNKWVILVICGNKVLGQKLFFSTQQSPRCFVKKSCPKKLPKINHKHVWQSPFSIKLAI